MSPLPSLAGRRAMIVLAMVGGCASPPRGGPSAPPVLAYDVYAVRYATVPSFPLRALIAGADSTRRTDLAMMVWLLKGSDGRNVLVDAGFYREKFLRQWKPRDYQRPSAALAPLGVKAEDVSDVIVTHVHWDHMDGLDLFPNARVWIQREEFTHHTNDAGDVLDRNIDTVDAQMLASLRRTGRVHLVDGDSVEAIPGLVLFTGGKHTFASQYVAVQTRAGRVILASDNVYLYENIDRHRPIAQTLDSASNLRTQDRMLRQAASERLIVPGHDPQLFARFRLIAPGIVKIE